MITEGKAQAFEALLDELSTALADMAQAMTSGQESNAEIATALADMVALLEARKGDGSPISSLTEAIKSLRDVTVNVSPTPVTVAAPVVQIIERVQPGEYEMRFTYDRHDRLETARLVPVAAQATTPEPMGPRVIWPKE